MPPETNTTGQNGTPSAAPGVLLVGILLVPISVFLNPWLLNKVWPPLFRAEPSWWWPICAVHLLLVFLVLRCARRWKTLGKTPLANLMFHRVPALGGALHALLLLLSMLVCAELLFWRINVSKAARNSGGSGNRQVPTLYYADPILGLKPAPGTSFEHLCYENPDRKPIFKKTYNLDENGFRVVPQPDAPKLQHAAFFGCSITFGIGCGDDETYPSQFAQLSPETKVYNFAFSSYCPSQALLLLQRGVAKHIGEEEGAAFFLFFPDHVARLLPRIRYATSWTRGFPAFRLDNEGKARFFGTLETAYPERLQVLDAISNEHIIRWAGLDFPNTFRPEDLDLCSAILSGARDVYRKRFPQNEFYVILDPVCFVDFDVSAFISALNKRGVPILSAEGVYGDAPWSLHYPRDRHPRPKANVRLASWLVEQFPSGLRTIKPNS